MTPLDILKAARAKIEKPEKWIKHIFCDGRGCYCALGAIITVHHGPSEQRSSASAFLSKAIGGDPIADWNDAPERTHSDVLKAFDRAIELASQP